MHYFSTRLWFNDVRSRVRLYAVWPLKPLFKYSFAILLFGIVAVGGLGGLNLYTYQRFTEERAVAQLTFAELGERRFLVTLVPEGQAAMQLVLAGDEWQLDVRMIKWTDWLTFLGEPPLYRLDRLSGRYASIEDARINGRTMHALAADTGIDVWSFARRAGDWLPGVDAAYGSSVYLPMAAGASYDVYIARTGLLARKRDSRGAK